MTTLRMLQRRRAVICTPSGFYLYVKHLPRRVKRTVKKGILRRPLRWRELREAERYIRQQDGRDQGHRFRKPKSAWGPGPWQGEPDYVDFVSSGLHCVVLRNTWMTGALNGYVGVPPGHPWWGKERNECVAVPQCRGEMYDPTAPFARFFVGDTRWDCEHKPESMVDVHGGLTFSGPAIEPVPKAKHRDLWWFAFDTGHAFDFQPMSRASMREIWPSEAAFAAHRAVLDPIETYRDLAYVKHEVEQLAAQIAMAGQVTHD